MIVLNLLIPFHRTDMIHTPCALSHQQHAALDQCRISDILLRYAQVCIFFPRHCTFYNIFQTSLTPLGFLDCTFHAAMHNVIVHPDCSFLSGLWSVRFAARIGIRGFYSSSSSSSFSSGLFSSKILAFSCSYHSDISCSI